MFVEVDGLALTAAPKQTSAVLYGDVRRGRMAGVGALVSFPRGGREWIGIPKFEGSALGCIDADL